MPFGSDLGQCWQSDLSLPEGALTFPHLDLRGSGPAPLYISGDQEGRVNHVLISQPLQLTALLSAKWEELPI